MKLLIADDDVTIRMLLYATAEYSGFEPLLAETGIEAISLFDEHHDIALVLTNVYLPQLDGIAVARHVRMQKRPVHVPVVFMTGINSDELLAEFLEIGDDIVTQPFSQTVILAKLAAHRRLVEMHRKLAQQNQTLRRFRDVTEAEHFVASEVIQRSMLGGLTTLPGVLYYTQPMSTFNGDSVLLARHRSGSCYFMVTDVSGHGLPAAMGTLPLIEAFLAQVWAASSVGSLAERLNQEFCRRMPDYLLAALLLGEIDARGAVIKLWNGGMPPALLLDTESHLIRILPSQHMPLGAQHHASFCQDCEVVKLQPGEQFLCFSDGVIEARNTEGRMFGLEALRTALSTGEQPDDVVARVASAVAAFRDGGASNDDLTLFCYRHVGPLPLLASDPVAEDSPSATPVPLQCRFELGHEALSHPECLYQVLSMLRGHLRIADHFGTVATVMTELFNNALEHGVLGLPSVLKDDSDGLIGYWEERHRRLSMLTPKDHISIEIGVHDQGDQRDLSLIITDSGAGFHASLSESGEPASEYHGRGLGIVRSLVTNLVYEGSGNRAVATLALGNHCAHPHDPKTVDPKTVNPKTTRQRLAP